MLPKFTLIVALSAATCFPLSAFASEPLSDRHTICIENHIRSLKFRESIWVANKNTDYCDRSATPEGIPPELEPWIRHLGSIHRAEAGLVDLDPVTLYRDGVDIEVQVNEMGDFASGAGGTEISIAVTPDWRGQLVNASLYAHELGHVVMSLLEDRSPSYRVVSGLMWEGIADLFAYEVVGYGPRGEVFFGEGIPSCFGDSRRADFSTSFDAPTPFFYDSYFLKQLVSCCKTLDFSRWGPSLPGTCRTFERALDETERAMEYPRELEKIPFDPLRLAGKKFVDDHQLGWVFNNFFIELGSRLSLRPLKMVLNAISEAERAELLSQEFSCFVVADPKDQYSYSRLSFRRVLHQMRSALKIEDRILFDRLFEKYRIEKGLIWADLGDTRGVTFDFENNLQRVLKPENPCRSGDRNRSECEARCEKH